MSKVHQDLHILLCIIVTSLLCLVAKIKIKCIMTLRYFLLMVRLGPFQI